MAAHQSRQATSSHVGPSPLPVRPRSTDRHRWFIPGAGHIRRIIAPAALLLSVASATLIACGGDAATTEATPTPFFASGAGTDEAIAPPASTPTRFAATTPPPATPAPPDAAAPDTGTVTVGGASYAFTVRTCTVVNGEPYLVGDGGASVALASLLLVQLPGRASYTVDDPDVAASGRTVTASGTAINITSPCERVEVTLTATCSSLAN